MEYLRRDDTCGSQVIDEWCVLKGITRHGYQGGGYDGNNCNLVLLHVDSLGKHIPPLMAPFIQTLRAFSLVCTPAITPWCFTGLSLSQSSIWS